MNSFWIPYNCYFFNCFRWYTSIWLRCIIIQIFCQHPGLSIVIILATSKGHVSGMRGGVKIYIFLKSIYLTLSPCKISAPSDNFEFWRVFWTPSKIRRRGTWAGSMISSKVLANTLTLTTVARLVTCCNVKKGRGSGCKKVARGQCYPHISTFNKNLSYLSIHGITTVIK